MISLSHLQAAKAFLCWDIFPGLAMQLVPVQGAAAWYFPPDPEIERIFLFYDPGKPEQENALYYLFHEAGHLLQKKEYSKDNGIDEFKKMLDLDRGAAKVGFERQAWDLGAPLLERFLQSQKLDEQSCMQAYRQFASLCITTYEYS